VSVDFPHRVFPCDECPVRCDNAGNPKSKFPAAKWADLRASIDDGTGGSAGLNAPLFGCHKGAPGTDADLACAGWLAVFGERNLSVRLALLTGRLSPAVLEPGVNWPPLYDSWEAMVAGQTWQPGDPNDHLPKDLGGAA
jgi:hypothetical protein